jgi:UDP-glucuronate decarboxylase
MLIGIIGNGFVGKATQLFKSTNIDIIVYDIIPELCIPTNISFDYLLSSDLIFICLPTPMNPDGSCHTKIIEDTIIKLHNLNYYNIIIRSTVPINFCSKFNVIYMPEFLTELNWNQDFINSKYWLISSSNINNTLILLINTAYNNNCIKSNIIHFLDSNTLELIKLVSNVYLANKVGFFNEIYNICIKFNINYNNIINILKLDSRIGSTHLNVPNNNQFGYGGTCFPKDTNSLYNQMNRNNIKSYYIQNSLHRNEYHDRINRDWLNDINRTVIHSNKKVILVTGGCGFIGSNLCHKLVNDNNNFIICLDNLSSGLESNIKDLFKLDNFIFMNHDVKNKMFFSKLDEIYHLACPASPPFYQKNPIKTIKTCVLGMLNILKLCKIHKCKLLFSSTSEIYGDPLEHPQKESYWGNVNPVGIRSNYDESKRMCETMIYEYRKKYNLNLKIVRIFNTYGPRMRLDDGRVITNFIKSINDNNPLTIYGDGNQTRSFCYIDDLLDGFNIIMNSQELGPINLGNPSEFTINELVTIFETIYNKKLLIEYIQLPLDDPKQRKPDITKAKQLNWEPKIKLIDGIQKMINYSFCTKT